MTDDQAFELAAHFTGGLLLCSVCEKCPCDDFMATQPVGGYDDALFARWLRDQQWHFEWREHAHEREPNIWYLPFVGADPTRKPTSISWSFA